MDRLTHIAPFGVAWEDLDLTRLEAFFADADEEPLTWEAKGGGPDGLRRDQIVKAVCGFANSELGGFIVKVTRERRRQPLGYPKAVSEAASGTLDLKRVAECACAS